MKKSLLFILTLLIGNISFAQNSGNKSFEDELLLKLLTAQPGDIIDIPKGTFTITKQLSLSVDYVTIRGQGMDDSILDFSSQNQGAEGLLVTSNNVILENFTIQNTIGDAVKANQVDGFTIRQVRTRWTRGPHTENGGYGIYPVLSRNILIEGCETSDASDTGIYVGQSENIIVRQNRAFHNVAGIEIENSKGADVYDNYVHANAGGILVYSMPGLTRPGEQTRVFGNIIFDNNIDNFSPPSNTVGDVPAGTGIMITANKKVEVFNNFLSNHSTTNILLVSYLITGRPTNDGNYDPYIESIYVHDNTMLRVGYDPKGGSSELTQELVVALRDVAGLPFPDVLYDGSFNPSNLNEEGKIPDNLKICLDNNHSISFLNLDLPNDFVNMTRTLAPHKCQLTRLPKIVLSHS